MAGVSILAELCHFEGERGRIVDFIMTEDKRGMLVWECARNVHYAELNKAEFGKMIDELKALHAEMKA